MPLCVQLGRDRVPAGDANSSPTAASKPLPPSTAGSSNNTTAPALRPPPPTPLTKATTPSNSRSTKAPPKPGTSNGSNTSSACPAIRPTSYNFMRAPTEIRPSKWPSCKTTLPTTGTAAASSNSAHSGDTIPFKCGPMKTIRAAHVSPLALAMPTAQYGLTP